MPVIVKVAGGADGNPTPHDGRYVMDWNPHTKFGTLELTSTDDRAAARQWQDIYDMFRERQMISNVQPLRPDRRPNRPLCGITILILPVPDDAA